MPDIPITLRKEDFRFIKVKKEGKRPLESDWQKNNNYKYDDLELKDHLKRKGNYGVLCGRGNLVVIDCDTEEIEKLVDKHLPDTFKVRTGGGGAHYYYKCEDIDKPIRLSSGDAQGDVGDIQYKGKQVIGPSSTHPTGKKYQVENNGGISKINVSKIRKALADYIKNEIEDVKEEEKELRKKHSEIDDLSMTDVVSTGGLRKHGKEYQGAHPVHGSDTGQNFCINISKNTWHCFRHDTGGGPLSWIAVEEGIINCDEAIPGKLRGDNFKKVLDVVEDRFDIDLNKKISDELKGELKERIRDINKISWGCDKDFFTFTKEIEFDDMKNIDYFDTYELPLSLGSKLEEKNIVSRGIWKCEECGKFHYRKNKPHYCFNEECDCEKFSPLHPHDPEDIGDVLMQNYSFAVPTETIDENNIGRLHIYKDGIYEWKMAKGLVMRKIKKMRHKSKNNHQRHVLNHISVLNQYPEDRFGVDGRKVVLKEGILNLESMDMIEHDPTELAISKFDIVYNPDTKCPKWKEYLKESFTSSKDIKRLQEFLGTALVNQKLHKKGIIIVGPTDAGKSTMVKIILGIFGDENTSSQGPTILSNTRWGKAKLRGKLLNATDEVASRKMKNLSVLKKILAGNKTDAEEKGKKKFEFRPTCEHIFCANQTPGANRKDDAFWNRWIVLDMPKSIPEDQQNPNMAEEILEEREGIFNWILEGYKSFIKDGERFSHPMHWEDARDKWLEWGDSIQRFIHQCIEIDDNNKISSERLHQEYSNFAKEHNLDVESQRKLTSAVKKLSYANYSENYKINNKKRRGFKNITVNNTHNTYISQSYAYTREEEKQSSLSLDEPEKKRVIRVMEEMYEEYDEGIPLDKIYDRLEEEFEMDMDEIDKRLDHLKNKGVIYISSHSTEGKLKYELSL